MKVKLRLDANAVKDFFVGHVEKLALAVIVVVFLLFVYGAAGHERLDFTPSELSTEAQNATEHIAKADPKHFIQKLKSVDYLAESHRIRNPIQAEAYQYKNLWNPPLFGIPEPRIPQLYTVEGLRGEAGYGAMTVPVPKTANPRPASVPGTVPAGINSPMSQAGAVQVVGQRWVVLTGLIDLAKQMEAYRDAFGNTVVSKFAPAATANRGMSAPTFGLEPDYCWVTVERAELSDNGEIDANKWQLIDSKAQLKTGQVLDPKRPTNVARAPGLDPTIQGGDVVTPSFLTLSRYVAFPLPPVHDHRWGPEVAHTPEIPLHAEMVEKFREEQMRQLEELENAQEEPSEGAETKEGGDPGAPPDDFFFQSGVNPTGLPGAPGSAAAIGDRRRLGAQGFGMPGVRQPGTGPGGPTGSASGLHAAREPIQLFRFFDFTVEPGKRYRYRVCLWLINPCGHVPPQFRSYLPPELAEERFLKSDWSEPSDIVTVPRDSRLLAGTVKSARTEPTASLMLIHFDENTGDEKSLELPDVVRGQLVNYLQEIELILPDPQGPNPPLAGNLPPQPPQGGNRKPNKETRTNTYHSDILVLDILGGDRLTSRNQKLTRPGQLLLMDADGNLVVRGELDDAQSIAHYKPPAPAPTPDRAPGPPGGRPGGLRQPPPPRKGR